MRIKKVILRDTLTRIPVLVLQFEQADEAFLDITGFGPGAKIVLKFSGSDIFGLAGYKFRELLYRSRRDDGSLDSEWDRTMVSFGQLIDKVDNILHLPDEINVAEIRLSLNELLHQSLIKDWLTEALDEFMDHSQLRKVIYTTRIGWIGTALIDVQGNSLAASYSTSSGRENEIAQFLWIPVEKATDAEVTPFKIELEFKQYALSPKKAK